MMKVAKLDKQNRLVGIANKKKPNYKDIDMENNDLPLDGSYYWDPDARTFLPVRLENVMSEQHIKVNIHIFYDLVKNLPEPRRPEADVFIKTYEQKYGAR